MRSPFTNTSWHISLFHKHVTITSLPHDTSFTHDSSTDCPWTRNSFLHTHPSHMQRFRRQLLYTHLRQLLRTTLSHITLSRWTLCNSRSSTISLIFAPFPVQLQALFEIFGRNWLVGLSGPLITKASLAAGVGFALAMNWVQIGRSCHDFSCPTCFGFPSARRG